MSHTPGPWKWDGYWLRGQGDLILWYTTDDNGVHAKPENARLIAAAPAMLEALEEMLEVHGVRWEHVRGDSSIPASWVELSDKARAVIKAAKGEA